MCVMILERSTSPQQKPVGTVGVKGVKHVMMLAQREPGARDAHVDPICHRDTAEKSTAPQASILEGDVDTKLADVDPRDRRTVDVQREAGDSFDDIEEKEECVPCATGGQGKLQACTAVDQHTHGDVTFRLMLSWSYLLFTWVTLACAVKM